MRLSMSGLKTTHGSLLAIAVAIAGLAGCGEAPPPAEAGTKPPPQLTTSAVRTVGACCARATLLSR